MQVMDKRAQKIIDKCHILISQGYDLEYCLKRFKGYEAEIRDYFSIAEELGTLRKARPSKEFREKQPRFNNRRAESREGASCKSIFAFSIPEKAYSEDRR